MKSEFLKTASTGSCITPIKYILLFSIGAWKLILQKEKYSFLDVSKMICLKNGPLKIQMKKLQPNGMICDDLLLFFFFFFRVYFFPIRLYEIFHYVLIYSLLFFCDICAFLGQINIICILKFTFLQVICSTKIAFIENTLRVI